MENQTVNGDKYTVKINGWRTAALAFAYDGCHKIYLIENLEDVPEVLEHGYKILPIQEIKYIWEEDACALKFIRTWSDLDGVIDQGYEGCAKFKFYK